MKNQNQSVMRFLFIALLAFAAPLGCGEGDNGKDNEGVNQEKGGDEKGDQNGGDENGDQNGGEEDPQGLPESCEGECLEHSLEFEIGGKDATIERGVYGLTAPELTEDGVWELYIQGVQGGYEGCPEFDSPTPDWELVLMGMPAEMEGRTYTRAEDGISAVFFDYMDEFTEELALVASAVIVDPVAAKIDLENAGQDDAEGVVSLDVEIVFGNERDWMGGRLVATHCASMDELGAGN